MTGQSLLILCSYFMLMDANNKIVAMNSSIDQSLQHFKTNATTISADKE